MTVYTLENANGNFMGVWAELDVIKKSLDTMYSKSGGVIMVRENETDTIFRSKIKSEIYWARKCQVRMVSEHL